MGRLRNVAVSVNRLVFCIVTLGQASPDQTMSAAAYAVEQKGLWAGRVFRPLIDILFWFDSQHCYNQWLYEKQHYRHYGSAAESHNAAMEAAADPAAYDFSGGWPTVYVS